MSILAFPVPEAKLNAILILENYREAIRELDHDHRLLRDRYRGSMQYEKVRTLGDRTIRSHQCKIEIKYLWNNKSIYNFYQTNLTRIKLHVLLFEGVSD